MTIKKHVAMAALMAATSAQAAFVTTNEVGLDNIYSQASFGANIIDIRIGAVTQLVRPDLLNLTTGAGIIDIFSQHTGAANIVNFFFVDTISFCGGGFNVNYIGCGQIGVGNFVVESLWAADNAVQAGGFTFGEQLLAHELGHNLGLGHRAGDFLMNPFINGFGDLNGAEVATILSSNLVQTDFNGARFITINPVWVVAEATRTVPEPSTLLLALSALTVVGTQRRRRVHRA
jgi:hypothetical protein